MNISSLNRLYNSSSLIFEQRFVIKVPFKHLSTNKVEGIIFGRVVGIFKIVVVGISSGIVVLIKGIVVIIVVGRIMIVVGCVMIVVGDIMIVEGFNGIIVVIDSVFFSVFGIVV